MTEEKKNVYTLDKMRADIDRQFSPVRLVLADGEEIVLRSVLRLGEKERKAVLKDLEELSKAHDMEPAEDATDEEAAELGVKRFDKLSKVAAGILEKICQRGKGKQLLADLDGDVPLMLNILSTWIEATQPGEAEPSPSS